jgi:hypothetical protein
LFEVVLDRRFNEVREASPGTRDVPTSFDELKYCRIICAGKKEVHLIALVHAENLGIG